MENLTQRWTKSGRPFQNHDIFSIFKKSKGGLLSAPCWAPVSVSEHAQFFLKIFE